MKKKTAKKSVPRRKKTAPDLERLQLLAVMDGMDEPVYISDPDTQEVLYANRALRDAFGDVVGRKCHLVFHSLESPCPFCNNEKIFGKNLGKQDVWKFKSRINNRWYRCIDRAIEWPDGRSVRCEISVDITELAEMEEELKKHRDHLENLVGRRAAELEKANEALRGEIEERKQTEASVRRRSELESFVSRISSGFVGAADIDGAITASLAEICGFCRSERGYLVLFEKGSRVVEKAHEWRAPGRKPFNTDRLDLTQYTWTLAKLAQGEIIIKKPGDPLPPEAEKEKILLDSLKIPAFITMPVFVSKHLAGAICLDCFREDTVWDEYDISGLRISSEILGSALERKWARDELMRSRERFRTLVDTMNEGVGMDDENGRIGYVNDRICDMLGYSRDEMIGMKTENVVHESHRNIFRERMQQRRTGENSRYEMSLTGKDGHEIPVSISPKPMFDPDGKYTGSFAVMTDMTKIKRAGEALRRSEEQYKRLVDTMSDGLGVQNEKGLIVYANTRFREMLGYSEKEMLDHPPGDFVHDDDIEEFKRRMEDRRKGKDASYELAWRKKDGSKITTLISPKALLDPDGTFRGAFAVITDITERRRMQEERDTALKERERVMETVPDIIYALDLTGHLSSWNRMLEAVTGYTRGDIEKMHALEFFAEEDRPKVAAAIQRVYSRGRAEVEADFLTKDRRRIRHIFSGSVLATESGQVIGITGVGKDIDELRRAEAEKNELREQLIQAQKMEAVGTLAGGMAHDFNNTLAVIMGSAESALRKLPEHDPNAKRIRKILDAARRSRNLTMKLLTFTRKEALNVTPFPVNSVVGDLVDIFKRGIPKNVTIRTRLSPAALSAGMDINQMQQAMLNILINAADAMPDGGLLTIETEEAVLTEKDLAGRPERKPGRYCLVRISDTGHGIPADTLGKIFEPFFTTKERGKGTGLGLSITHGIVAGHGGFMDVASREGKGTAVSVFLPAAVETAPAAEARRPREKPRGGHETILIVDDDADLVEMISEALEIEGYKPLGATSGRQAVEILQQRPGEVALVILDMIMPEMDGRATFSEIKKAAPDLNVILCSGYSSDDQTRQLIAAGARGYIQKPFDFASVLAAVRETLDGKTVGSRK